MPVNTMAMPAASAAAITSSSRIEPPGWMTAVAPASMAETQPVGKGEERVGGHHRALRQRLGQPAASAASSALRAAMRAESTRLIWPAPMPTVAPSLRIDDGVRLDVLGHPEGEAQIGEFRFASARACVTTVQVEIVDRRIVARLDQQAAGDRLAPSCPARRGSGRPPVTSSRRFFLRRNDRLRLLAGVGRDDHLGEDLDDLVRGLPRRAAGSAATMPPKAETGSQASALR